MKMKVIENHQYVRKFNPTMKNDLCMLDRCTNLL